MTAGEVILIKLVPGSLVLALTVGVSSAWISLFPVNTIAKLSAVLISQLTAHSDLPPVLFIDGEAISSRLVGQLTFK